MKKILFVTHTFNQKRANGDPSVWYRVHNCAKSFSDSGYHAETVNQWELEEKDIDISRYDSIIFFRPVPDRALFDLIEKADALGIKYAASYDDPIFDTSGFGDDSTLKSGASGAQMNERYRDWANSFTIFDRYIVSTHELAKRIKKLKETASVYVIDNFLPPEYIKYAEFICRKNSEKSQLIGYFAGGKSHISDIKLIKAPLHDFCLENNYKLLLPHCFEQGLSDELKSVSIFFPRVSYAEMLTYYSIIDFAIAPLKLDRNSICKSAIKYYEAIACHKVLVASPLEALIEFKDSRSLLFAESHDDWSKQMTAASKVTKDIIDQDRLELLEKLSFKKQQSIKYFMES